MKQLETSNSLNSDYNYNVYFKIEKLIKSLEDITKGMVQSQSLKSLNSLHLNTLLIHFPVYKSFQLQYHSSRGGRQCQNCQFRCSDLHQLDARCMFTKASSYFRDGNFLLDSRVKFQRSSRKMLPKTFWSTLQIEYCLTF